MVHVVDMDDEEALRAAALLGFEYLALSVCAEDCWCEEASLGCCVGYCNSYCRYVTWVDDEGSTVFAASRFIAARQFLRQHGIDAGEISTAPIGGTLEP
jgi:hypothetical protein